MLEIWRMAQSHASRLSFSFDSPLRIGGNEPIVSRTLGAAIFRRVEGRTFRSLRMPTMNIRCRA